MANHQGCTILNAGLFSVSVYLDKPHLSSSPYLPALCIIQTCFTEAQSGFGYLIIKTAPCYVGFISASAHLDVPHLYEPLLTSSLHYPNLFHGSKVKWVWRGHMVTPPYAGFISVVI